jgi:hypothetical protein
MGESQHQDPGSGMNNPDHIFKSLETIFLLFLGLKYLNSLMRFRDPGWRQFGSGIRDGKKSDPGSGNQDKHPGSATLSPWNPETAAAALPPQVQQLLEEFQ